jgi:hypothetical protein
MRYVKVQYDAYNRKFEVADPELATELDDGGLYLVADFFGEDFLPPAAIDIVENDRPLA